MSLWAMCSGSLAAAQDAPSHCSELDMLKPRVPWTLILMRECVCNSSAENIVDTFTVHVCLSHPCRVLILGGSGGVGTFAMQVWMKRRKRRDKLNVFHILSSQQPAAKTKINACTQCRNNSRYTQHVVSCCLPCEVSDSAARPAW